MHFLFCVTAISVTTYLLSMHLIYTAISIFLVSLSLSAQCYPKRHSTAAGDSWVGCSRQSSPNPDRTRSHWLLYELNVPRSIEEIAIWNGNIHGEEDMNVTRLAVDYSMDGQSWSSAGEYSLALSDSDPTYEGETLDQAEPFSAKYILLTALENNGDPNCVNISEVRFGLAESTTSTSEEEFTIAPQVYPNPMSQSAQVDLGDPEYNIQRWQLIDILGRVVAQGEERTQNFDLRLPRLSEGSYILQCIDDQSQVRSATLSIAHPE